LAQSLWQDADKAVLTHFADELEREAAALELSRMLSLPPVVSPYQQVQQPVQQKPADSSPPFNVPMEVE
jgi:hypothetical protein